jgi:hypothetical protein
MSVEQMDMKITKISQVQDAVKAPTGQTHTQEIMMKISQVFQKKLSSWYVASGSVAWFLYDDGNEYEVIVSPARYGHHRNIREGELEGQSLASAKDRAKKDLDSGKITRKQYDARMREMEQG